MIRSSAAAALGALFVAAAGAWLVAGGWIDPQLVALRTTSVMARDVPGFVKESLALAEPKPWLQLGALLEMLGGPTTLAVLPVLAVGVGGVLLGKWYEWLRSRGWNAGSAVGAIALLGVHPFTLWALSRTGPDILALAAFAIVTASIRHLAEERAARRVVSLSLVIACWSWIDPRFIYCAPALLPLVIGSVPAKMVREAPSGLLLVLGVPVGGMLALSSWLGWASTGEWTAALAALGSHVCDLATPESGSWLGPDGEHVLGTVGAGSAILLVGSPVLGWYVLRPGVSLRLAGVLVGACTIPLVGLATASISGCSGHPLRFLFLAVAPVVAVLAECRTGPQRATALGLLLLGVVSAWVWVARSDEGEIVRWRTALLHRPLPEPHPGERALAAFLADGLPTLIDDRLGMPVVAALGRADRLILPPDPLFLEQVIARRPTVPQIAVPDPRRPGGERDRLNRAFPDLWERGPPGGSWRLVYDRSGWRVWRREERGADLVGPGPRSVPNPFGERRETAS